MKGAGRRPRAAGRSGAAALTAREVEIVRMVGQGLSNPQIARGLFITVGTVKVHMHNIYRKLYLGSRVALALYAQEKGLL